MYTSSIVMFLAGCGVWGAGLFHLIRMSALPNQNASDRRLNNPSPILAGLRHQSDLRDLGQRHRRRFLILLPCGFALALLAVGTQEYVK